MQWRLRNSDLSQKRKVTLYFNSAMLAETQKEAIRQDRSVSWIIQAAWRIARDEVKRMPDIGALDAGEFAHSWRSTPEPHFTTRHALASLAPTVDF
jgi:uncharacterized small protein (TIGR04563 family)